MKKFLTINRQKQSGHHPAPKTFDWGAPRVPARTSVMALLLTAAVMLSTAACRPGGSARLSPGAAPPAGKPFPEHGPYVEKYLGGFPENTQVSMAMISGRSVHYSGFMKQGASIVAVDNSRKAFEIGSITKVFTATLLADLVLQGHISLDENVQNRLDIVMKGMPAITYRQLANHTSGLPPLPSSLFWKAMFGFLDTPFLDNPFKDYSSADLKADLQKKPALDAAPGERYQYSNFGYGLLGCLVTEIEDASFEHMLREKITTPYQMPHTTSIRSRVGDILVNGLDKKGRPTPNWDFQVMAGAGALLSTTRDLSRFALAQFDKGNRVLALTRQQTFRDPEKFEIGENRFSMAVGLGWHILTGPAGDKWYWHNGGTKGYHSSMVLDVDNKKGVVILSNVSAYNHQTDRIEDLLFALMRSLAGPAKPMGS